MTKEHFQWPVWYKENGSIAWIYLYFVVFSAYYAEYWRGIPEIYEVAE